MKLKLRPYPAYKRVSPEWLNQIPSHWQLKPGWSVMRERKVKNIGFRERNVLSLSYGRIVRRDLSRLKGLLPASFETYQILEPGNIVMRTTDMQNDQTSLRFGHVKERGIITSAYLNLEAKCELRSEFLYRYLHALDTMKIFYGMGSGLRQSIDFSHFKRLPVPIPPTHEQAVIVRYLNWLDDTVNRLIRAKQRLIELLNEQKQAIIQRAVTRGLDPDVRLKQSGVEWLGEVPEHWPLDPNRAHLKLRRESVGSKSSDYTLLSLTMQGIIPRDLENAKGKFPASFDTYQVVKPGDFVFCLFDIDETPRTVGIARQEGMITGAYTVFSCKDESIRDYFYYLYLALDNIKALKPVYTGLRKVIPKPVFLGLKSPVPPENERIRIVKFIRDNVRELDEAINKARKEIEFIGEYRTRLISDVVTGKLDVRGVDVPDVAHLEELLETEIPGGEEHFSMQEAV